MPTWEQRLQMTLQVSYGYNIDGGNEKVTKRQFLVSMSRATIILILLCLVVGTYLHAMKENAYT